jgi:hypothetical protein
VLQLVELMHELLPLRVGCRRHPAWGVADAAKARVGRHRGRPIEIQRGCTGAATAQGGKTGVEGAVPVQEVVRVLQRPSVTGKLLLVPCWVH